MKEETPEMHLSETYVWVRWAKNRIADLEAKLAQSEKREGELLDELFKAQRQEAHVQ